MLKKWRLSILDLLIILIAVSGGLLFIRSQGGSAILPGASSETVRYVVEFNGMSEEAAERIRIGDSITDRIEKHAMGKVVEIIEIGPYILSSKDTVTGEYRLNEVPDRYRATLVIESPALVTHSSITVGRSYVVRTGAEISTHGPGYGGVGFIVDIMRDELEG